MNWKYWFILTFVVGESVGGSVKRKVGDVVDSS